MTQTMGLDEGRRRAVRHDSEDGLGEIVLGSVMPRTGYVALPDPSKRSRAIRMLPFFAIAIAASAFPFLQHRANAFPFGLSLLFTGIFIVGAFQYRMWHLFFPAAAAPGTAGWIWIFRLGGEGTTWLVLAAVGAALLLSGVVRLVLFLRRYPKPA